MVSRAACLLLLAVVARSAEQSKDGACSSEDDTALLQMAGKKVAVHRHQTSGETNTCPTQKDFDLLGVESHHCKPVGDPTPFCCWWWPSYVTDHNCVNCGSCGFGFLQNGTCDRGPTACMQCPDGRNNAPAPTPPPPPPPPSSNTCPTQEDFELLGAESSECKPVGDPTPFCCWWWPNSVTDANCENCGSCGFGFLQNGTCDGGPGHCMQCPDGRNNAPAPTPPPPPPPPSSNTCPTHEDFELRGVESSECKPVGDPTPFCCWWWPNSVTDANCENCGSCGYGFMENGTCDGGPGHCMQCPDGRINAPAPPPAPPAPPSNTCPTHEDFELRGVESSECKPVGDTTPFCCWWWPNSVTDPSCENCGSCGFGFLQNGTCDGGPGHCMQCLKGRND